MERQLGDVVHFNPSKGFGFLADAQEQQHYFHIRFVQPLINGARPVPRIGDLFYFSVRPSTSKQGHDEAFDLEIARRTQSVPTNVEVRS